MHKYFRFSGWLNIENKISMFMMSNKTIEAVKKYNRHWAGRFGKGPNKNSRNKKKK